MPRPTTSDLRAAILSYKRATILRILRDPRARVDINAKTGLRGAAAIHALAAAAAQPAAADTMELLLRRAGTALDVNQRDNAGDAALHRAARAGHLAVVRMMLDCPEVDCNAVNDCGQTPVTVCLDRLKVLGAYGGRVMPQHEEQVGQLKACAKLLLSHPRVVRQRSGNAAAAALSRRERPTPILPPSQPKPAKGAKKKSPAKKMSRDPRLNGDLRKKLAAKTTEANKSPLDLRSRLGQNYESGPVPKESLFSRLSQGEQLSALNNNNSVPRVKADCREKKLSVERVEIVEYVEEEPVPKCRDPRKRLMSRRWQH